MNNKKTTDIHEFRISLHFQIKTEPNSLERSKWEDGDSVKSPSDGSESCELKKNSPIEPTKIEIDLGVANVLVQMEANEEIVTRMTAMKETTNGANSPTATRKTMRQVIPVVANFLLLISNRW